MHVDLLVPVKLLARAKTRLLGAADGGAGSSQAHTRLALALARDTLCAAAGAATVRRLVVVCSDERVRAVLAEDGIETIPDEPNAGLNPALRHGEALLRGQHSTVAIGVLQADLPALRPEELDCAVCDGLATGRRAFCSDRLGTGTTLLLAPREQPLDPRFGPDSAAAHRASGAVELPGRWPGLRCDVDTVADLTVAGHLGLGRFTRAALAVVTP
ncbi:MAG: 2-phospho-L-lactate guanylyltransferase [Pseudonocardiaceae bacterium]